MPMGSYLLWRMTTETLPKFQQSNDSNTKRVDIIKTYDGYISAHPGFWSMVLGEKVLDSSMETDTQKRWQKLSKGRHISFIMITGADNARYGKSKDNLE